MLSSLARGSIFSFVVFLAACGGGNKPAQDPTENKAAESMDAIDQDPVVLLPTSPVIAGTFDVKTFVSDPALGTTLANLVDRYFPLGPEAGFSASKDLDRVIYASYSTQGVDVVATLSGRFDADKIAAVAKNHTPIKGGGFVVESKYADRTLYTVNNVGFTVLSSKTILCGTEGAMRRALERVKDGRLKRSFFPWMMDTLETKGAAFAIACDFANQPVSPQMLGPAGGLVDGLKIVRVVGNFEAPGLHVAATGTYKDEKSADAGASSLERIATLAKVFAMTSGSIPQMENLKIEPQKEDVQVSFALADKALRSFVTKLPELLGQ